MASSSRGTLRSICLNSCWKAWWPSRLYLVSAGCWWAHGEEKRGSCKDPRPCEFWCINGPNRRSTRPLMSRLGNAASPGSVLSDLPSVWERIQSAKSCSSSGSYFWPFLLCSSWGRERARPPGCSCWSWWGRKRIETDTQQINSALVRWGHFSPIWVTLPF